MRIKVQVNTITYERDIEENTTLLRFLREELGLTGTKEGCGSGECGACTVFFNGKTVNSCMVLAAEADGSVIETIEGESSGGMLSVLQKSFEKHSAVQCGFCTAGMIMSARELIHHHPHPTRAEIQEGLEGNFCRCTGYEQIIEAILDVTGGYEPKEELSYV